jgi:hypothetical protein
MLKSIILITLWVGYIPFLSAQELFKEAEAQNNIVNTEINEASGLAVSIGRPNLIWTHNDSGDKARIFLINENAESIAEYHLKGVKNRDWEDIATGPGPDEGKPYIYVGEIGDNRAIYDTKIIYRFEEPSASSALEISNFETIEYVYPDGKRDAESLFIDPLSKDIYILSKREDNIGIYVATYPQSTTEIITLQKLGIIPYRLTVAADITADGEEILLKTYNDIYYWKRNNRSISDTLSSVPTKVTYKVEPQGESIAWKKDGSGFFTLSEQRSKDMPILYFYAKQQK